MNVKERMLIFIEHLGIKVSKFEIECNLSHNYVKNLINGNIGPKIQRKISQRYTDLNMNWLLYGEGKMLKEENSVSPAVEVNEKHIRYWQDIDATAGGVESFNDIRSEYIPIVLPDFGDCTDAVNVRGESMQPLYNNGDIIILKEWTESFIEYGNVYLVVTRSGNRMIKRIRQGGDIAHVLCVSENPLYDPFEIERNDILRMYVVKGAISKNAM